MKRKLTKKSRMQFGKYADFTVGQLIDLHREDYLIWVYCNMSNIDFFDDILKVLRIPESEIIEKPGKDPDKRPLLMRNYFKQLKDEFGEEKYMHIINKRRSLGKKMSSIEKQAKKRFKSNFHSHNCTQ